MFFFNSPLIFALFISDSLFKSIILFKSDSFVLFYLNFSFLSNVKFELCYITKAILSKISIFLSLKLNCNYKKKMIIF